MKKILFTTFFICLQFSLFTSLFFVYGEVFADDSSVHSHSDSELSKFVSRFYRAPSVFQGPENSEDFIELSSDTNFGANDIFSEYNVSLNQDIKLNPLYFFPFLGLKYLMISDENSNSLADNLHIYFAEKINSLRNVNMYFTNVIIPFLTSYSANTRYSIQAAEGANITLASNLLHGDSAGSILSEWLPMIKILDLVEKSKDIHRLTSLRRGNPYYITIDTRNNKLLLFEYEINNTDILTIDMREDEAKVYKKSIPFELELAYISGNVQVNFFDSVLRTGENANFAIQLADVFSFDIDFTREIRNNDTFHALVEKRYRNGEFKGYGRIIGAKFINAGRTHNAFLFYESPSEDEKEQKEPNTSENLSNDTLAVNNSTIALLKPNLTYFDKEGKALQKAFLRSPVHFTRVSSRYSMSRKHPILGITRPHQGIDYAAPMGTPVYSVGDGVVTHAAYTGGYGHLIRVRHIGGLESQYGHLSRYAKGLRKGVRVKQGETIGYVGSTGLSTGPHLDFRIKKNGNFVDPDTIIIPSKPPVTAERMSIYNETMEIIEAYMNGDKKIEDYNPDTWLTRSPF